MAVELANKVGELDFVRELLDYFLIGYMQVLLKNNSKPNSSIHVHNALIEQGLGPAGILYLNYCYQGVGKYLQKKHPEKPPSQIVQGLMVPGKAILGIIQTIVTIHNDRDSYADATDGIRGGNW